MLEAYLDESGIHQGATGCVIAGYFGGPKRWIKFEEDWRQVLSDFKVPLREFHAKDLFPKLGGFFLHKWNGNQQQFLHAVASTIARHEKIRPIMGGIFVKDFYSFPHTVRRYFTGANISSYGKITTSGCPNKPYFMPFQLCVVRICSYSVKGSKANFFFGLDRPFAEYANTLFKQIEKGNPHISGMAVEWKNRLGTPSFPLAKESPQLQAADFFANLSYHHVLNAGREIQTAPPSSLLAKCIKNVKDRKQDFFFLDEGCLHNAIDEARIVSEMLERRRKRQDKQLH